MNGGSKQLQVLNKINNASLDESLSFGILGVLRIYYVLELLSVATTILKFGFAR